MPCDVSPQAAALRAVERFTVNAQTAAKPKAARRAPPTQKLPELTEGKPTSGPISTYRKRTCA